MLHWLCLLLQDWRKPAYGRSPDISVPIRGMRRCRNQAMMLSMQRGNSAKYANRR
jgi:hypothetical protein